uniref:Copine C-terminal domain-containing protein n=1 Tax=Tetranychus urticae TaxID=32264 RepID=T1KA33_TETUR
MLKSEAQIVLDLAIPTTQLQLSVSCRNLPNKDTFSKSDPQCTLYMKHLSEKDYLDIDTLSNDFLGHHETTLAEIVAVQGREYVGALKDERGRNAGTISVLAEEIANCKRGIYIKLKGCNILGTSFFTKPQTFLTFWWSVEDGSYSRKLCNGDFDRNIRIDCMRYKMSGAYILIGSFNTTLNDLAQRFNEPSRRKLTLKIEEEISFLDYIKGGTHLHFAVAIDFIASNGDPRYPESLHFIGSDKPNPYESALNAIDEILKPYNTLNVYPGFGFGLNCFLKPWFPHHFPLNGNVMHSYCKGIEEIIMHYRSTVGSAIARQYDDVPQTKQAIIDASHLPLSIIIVGVGHDDFAAIDELDSDNLLLKFNGKKAVRDIVQFVPLRNYITSTGIWLQTMDGLTRDILHEVPEQLISYMRAKGIKPKRVVS